MAAYPQILPVLGPPSAEFHYMIMPSRASLDRRALARLALRKIIDSNNPLSR